MFFVQERMGAGGRRFRIFKFRSMYVDADDRKRDVEHLNKHVEDGPRMFKVPADPRTTRFGCFLRRWSLDELPQLINVLRGEMSLVGPRPLILDEDQHIMGRQRRRLNLMPGVTGPWQVLGRSDIPFGEMITSTTCMSRTGRCGVTSSFSCRPFRRSCAGAAPIDASYRDEARDQAHVALRVTRPEDRRDRLVRS